MRNPLSKGGAPIGPKNGWGEWAERRARAIAKPRRKRTVNDLKPKAPEGKSDGQ